MNKQTYYDQKTPCYNLYTHNKYGNPLVLNLISEGATVYDIGCNTGSLARGIVKKKRGEVYGVDISPQAIKEARKFLVDGTVLDLEDFGEFPFAEVQFDEVVLADVLEHVRNPEEVLTKVGEQLKFKKLIVSLPNVAFVLVRLNLLLGKFKYSSHGIMDEGHLHFYTLETALELFHHARFSTQQVIPYPLTNRKLSFITHPLTRVFPTLLARQFVFVLVPKNGKMLEG